MNLHCFPSVWRKENFKKNTKRHKTKTISVAHGLLQWERALKIECTCSMRSTGEGRTKPSREPGYLRSRYLGAGFEVHSGPRKSHLKGYSTGSTVFTQLIYFRDGRFLQWADKNSCFLSLWTSTVKASSVALKFFSCAWSSASNFRM